MKILTLNRGSSSLKISIYEFSSQPDHFIEPIWKTEISWKGSSDQKSILEKLKNELEKQSIDCIGHRVVHGGKKHRESVLINAEVKSDIEDLCSLAPLHNRAALEGIDLASSLFPKISQVAVFDTAFHQSLPIEAKIYPGPYKWFEDGIERFGFHGISYKYCTKRAESLLQNLPEKMVLCHLGSGASLCAVKEGKSIDTSMGFTPLEGLMMDTRSGSVDPGILLHRLKTKTVEELSFELYDCSGLIGISGKSSDMRDIINAKDSDLRAKLAFDLYIHRLCSCIGSMVASLNGLDALVFTGGIGENASEVRKAVCSKLSFLGIKLEKEGEFAEDQVLSSSSPFICLIHTQEDFEIARQTFERVF